MAFKKVKNLTLPLFKFVVGAALNVRIETPIFLGKEMKAKDGDKKKEPAHLVNVVNLDTGEMGQIICSAVIVSVLNEEYPNNSYVGKSFEIARQERQPGKQYDKYSVCELEVVPDAPVTVAAGESTKAKK